MRRGPRERGGEADRDRGLALLRGRADDADGREAGGRERRHLGGEEAELLPEVVPAADDRPLHRRPAGGLREALDELDGARVAHRRPRDPARRSSRTARALRRGSVSSGSSATAGRAVRQGGQPLLLPRLDVRDHGQHGQAQRGGRLVRLLQRRVEVVHHHREADPQHQARQGAGEGEEPAVGEARAARGGRRGRSCGTAGPSSAARGAPPSRRRASWTSSCE